jgi:YD repeat-containing protein
MPSTSKILLRAIVTLSLCVTAIPASAADDVPEIEIADFQIAGDGTTPTFLQFLDAQGYDFKPAINLASATVKGDVVYSYDLALPPAILKPSLTLQYSSDAGMTLEMPYGWSLDGIAEIRRPLTRAYQLDGDKYDRDYLVSGPGFSGTLMPSGEDDYRYFLRTSEAKLVIAEFDWDNDRWKIFSNGVTWELTAKDEGMDSGAPEGTALWRVDTMTDTSGNSVAYDYHTDGRIKKISYGGNSKTGDKHLVDVEFDYDDNAAKRTDARAGFVVTFEKHVTLITIKAYDGIAIDSSVVTGGVSGAINGLSGTSSGKASATGSIKDSITKMTQASAITGGASSSDKTTGIAGKLGSVTGAASSPSVSEVASRDIFYAYDLVTTETDNLDLLTELQREGQSVLDTETIAEFTYGAFDSENKSARTGTGPSNLGATTGKSYSSNHRDDYSRTTKSLVDFNRDGLPDVIDSSSASSSSKTWTVTPQKVDYATRKFSWGLTYSLNAIGEKIQSITTEAPESWSEYTDETAETHTTHQLTDVDGDGYIDILVTDNEDEWIVYYGTGTHFGTGTVETPPHGWEYAQTALSLRADKVHTATTNEPDILQGLVDINGDGWLDAFTPDGGDVYYHSGTRGDGWGERQSVDSHLEAIRSVTYTIGSETFEIDSNKMEGYCKSQCQDVWDDEMASDCDEATSETDEADEDGDGYNDDCTEYDECRSDNSDCEDSSDEDECFENYCGEEPDDCDVEEVEGCDEDEYVSECTDECTDNGPESRQKYVSDTDEWQALYDMNGDGLVDQVSSYSTPWKVYLGNGHGFETAVEWNAPVKYSRRSDEGRPNVHWESSEMNIDQDESGSSAYVYQTLIDVDGDGLLDLALGKSLGDKWYKNTGSGFESTSRSLPTWWPDNFSTSSSTSEVDGDDGDSDSDGVTTGIMIDLDRDGAVDSVSVSASYSDSSHAYSVSSNTVKYGPYPRPYALTKVENGQGGETAVSYRSMGTVSPSGDFNETQHTPVVRHLADKISTTDTRNSQTSETSFEYADGFYEDGVFRGFESRTVTLKINGAETSSTSYDYELSRDLSPIVTDQELDTDANLNFAPSLDKGSASMSKRLTVENTYDDYGDTGYFFRLIKSRKVTEYGEKNGSKSTSYSYGWDHYGNLKSYTRDSGGDDLVLTTFSYVNDTEGATEDDEAKFYRMKGKTVSGTDALLGGGQTIVSLEYYYYDGHENSTDAVTAGLLTSTVTQSGWLGGGESLGSSTLTIDYTRGTRGELSSVKDAATGMQVDQTFGWGGAVLETQTNALGQKLSRTIDEQGRITSVKDDNGLTVTNTYDDFGRITKKQVTGKDGKTLTDKVKSYSRSSAPYYTKTKLYDDTGTVEATGISLEDGFGRAAQTWAQDEDGNYLVANEIFDLRGLSAETSHPQDAGASFSTSSVPLSVSKALGKSYYDALGNPREVVRDDDAGTGSRLVSYDRPRVETRQDEEGYQTKLTYDAHHRVIKVEQGKDSTYTTTAQYGYDPLNRLVKFQDGGGVCYGYSYDAAGRLREVRYGKTTGSVVASKTASKILSKTSSFPVTKGTLSTLASNCTPSTIWYKYEYTGPLKTKMTDLAGATTQWEYDAAGRVTKITASDSLPSSPGSLTYTFDYDDAWVGSIYKTTDPSGETEYAYDELGRVKDAKRTYTASSAGTTTASFSYDYDLRGRALVKTFPSGRTLTADYDYGHLAKLTAATSGVTDYTIGYDYNDWGLLKRATSSLGHVFSNTYTTPLWVDKNKIKYGTTAYERSYKWFNDGLLKERSVETDTTTASTVGSGSLSATSVAKSGLAGTLTSTASSKATSTTKTITKSSAGAIVSASSSSGTSSSTSFKVPTTPSSLSEMSTSYSYSYDNVMELSEIKTMLRTVESYAYDAAGNLTSMKDYSGATWTYGSAGTLNQVSKRTSDKGGSETYTYDGAGRVATWTDSSGTRAYYYDGLGRLRGATLNGVWQMVLDYDAGGNLLRRGDNNPFTGTPIYSYKFREWRYDEKTQTVTEEDNAFVSTEKTASNAATRTWLFKEYDGQPVMTFDDAGTKIMTRSSGGYGAAWSTTGTAWNWNSFHGAEEQGDVFHMGQRHLMQKDGQWLQPEPFLYSGEVARKIFTPLSLSTYRYAMNSPTAYSDTSGFDPEDQSYEDSYEDYPTSDSVTGEDSETGGDNSFYDLNDAVTDFANGVPTKTIDANLNETAKSSDPVHSENGCVNRTQALTETLLGNFTVANPAIVETTHPVTLDLSRMEYLPGGFQETQDHFGTNFERMTGPQIVSAMSDAGPGSIGLIAGQYTDGTAHIFTIVNYGNLNALDARISNAKSFDFMIVTPPGESPSE